MKEHPPPGFANDRYEKLEFLGSGGMGSVYRAVDKVLKRKVALKFLKEDVSKEMQGLVRMRREAQILSKLRHRGLVKIYAFEAASKPPYIVMELLEGQSLADILGENDTISDKEGLSLIRQIAAALAYLHGNNLIHRDIKPANLFLTNEGRWVLMDFGLVRTMDATRITIDGQLLGTLAFYPPELFRGKEFSTLSDIYQIGLVLHLAMTGKHLHPIPKDSMEWLNDVVKPMWKPLPIARELKEPFKSIVRDCCKIDLAERISNGSALLKIIETKEEPLPPRKVSTAPRSSTKRQSKRMNIPLLGTIGIIVFCLLLASLSTTPERKKHQTAPRRSNFKMSLPVEPPLPVKPLLIREAEKNCNLGAQVFAQLKVRDLVLNANRFAASMKLSAEHWSTAFSLSKRALTKICSKKMAVPVLVQSASYLLVLYDAQRIMVARGENILNGLPIPSSEELQALVRDELSHVAERFKKSNNPDFDDLQALLNLFETYANSRHWKLSHYLAPPWRQTLQDFESTSCWSAAAVHGERMLSKKRYVDAKNSFSRAIELLPKDANVSLRVLLLNEYGRVTIHLEGDDKKEGLKNLDIQLTACYENLLQDPKLSPDKFAFCLSQLELVAGRVVACNLSEVSDAALALIWLMEAPKPAWLRDRQFVDRQTLQKLVNRSSPMGVEYSLPALRTEKEMLALGQQALGNGSLCKAHWIFSALCCQNDPPFAAILGLIKTGRAANGPLGLAMTKSQTTIKTLLLLSRKEESTRWPRMDLLSAEQVRERQELLSALAQWEDVFGNWVKEMDWKLFVDKLPSDPIALAIRAMKKHGSTKRAMLLRTKASIEKMSPRATPKTLQALKELLKSPHLSAN